MYKNFCIRFSSLCMQFTVPWKTVIPAALADLSSPNDGSPDISFRLEPLSAPLVLHGTPIHTSSVTHIYQTSQGQLRVYPEFSFADGCQVACLLCPDTHNILYYSRYNPAFARNILHNTHLLAPEYLLIRRNAFLLHSSVVVLHSKAILFSGPSTAGKSTQASLWQAHLGAEILNGDRCVVMQRNGRFYGGGSPWAGTSGIYRPEQYPIAGIVLLGKSSENRIRRMGADAFAPLFGQTLVNSWDREFMEAVTALYADLLAQVPVYQLHCRPDADAAALACQTIFGKEMPDGTC